MVRSTAARSATTLAAYLFAADAAVALLPRSGLVKQLFPDVSIMALLSHSLLFTTFGQLM